jgi:transposase-like protein
MGKQVNGVPRCKCKTREKTFQTTYKNKDTPPQTKQMTIKMSLNRSGIRDISRVLHISQNTATATLKNKKLSHKSKPKICKPHKTVKNTP